MQNKIILQYFLFNYPTGTDQRKFGEGVGKQSPSWTVGRSVDRVSVQSTLEISIHITGTHALWLSNLTSKDLSYRCDHICTMYHLYKIICNILQQQKMRDSLCIHLTKHRNSCTDGQEWIPYTGALLRHRKKEEALFELMRNDLWDIQSEKIKM